MRFLSFLPILLLFAGSLGAQNQCSIYDLTATATPIDPASCQYYVALDFEHSGTTNQYTVKGNGVNYGTFSYDSIPLKLGPFTAGAAPGVKEFVVTDAVYGDCHDFVEIQIPGCAQNPTCDIYDMKVVTGDCNPGSLTYELTLNFKVANPGNDFFKVWAGNGTYLGLFPLNLLPLTIPVFPWSGDPVDHLKVCINDNPDCCETISFDAPDCNQTPCIITDLTVNRGACTSDSTYKLEVNFLLNNTPAASKFGLWANDEFLGIFGTDQLPLTIDSFPWNGGAMDFVKVCVFDIVIDPTIPPQIICCKIIEFQVPDCLPIYPCGIKNLTVETDSCSSDSTFGIWVNFTVNDTSAVDSFRLWGNGHDFGNFSLDSLPLYIPDFPWNNGIFSHIKVCTGSDPTCCKEYQFLAPDCLPFGPCKVTDIFVQSGACTSDSTYKVRLNFQATNPGNGTFIVWANNTLIDTFPLASAPLTLDSFPWDGGNVDVVKICIGSTNDTLPACCLEKEFHVPDCLSNDSCSITNVVVDPGDCNPGGDTYKVVLNFEVTNPGNDFFELWTGAGQYLGYFPLSQLPLTIPNFPCNNSGVGVLKICINDNPDCCTTVEFQAPNCCDNNAPCEITNLTVQTGNCSSDDSYEVWIDFDVVNPLGDHFGVWANGGFLGTFSVDSLPLYISDFPWNGGQNDVVKVCFTNSAGMVGCCKTLEFQVPDCLPQPCEIYNLTVETGDCTGDSTYLVWVNFQVQNPPADSFGLWANGEFLGTFHLDSLPLQLELDWNGGSNDVVKVCFGSPNGGVSCCRTKEFEVPDCLDQGGPCEIYDLSVETGDCTGDSTYQVWINFQVQNPPGNTFGLWINGQFYDTFSLDSLPLNIANFPWNGGSNDVIKVCFVNAGSAGCCRTKEFEVPDCLDQSGPCHISDLTIETGDCTSDSTYTVTINFQVDNPPADSFDLWANGSFFGTYSLNDLPLTIQDFPWDGGPTDHVKVCLFDDNAPPGQPFCCKQQPFQVPDCLDMGDPCEINDLTVETGDCTSDDTYEVWINFQVDNPPGDQFGVWANGDFLGLFDLDSLPLYIADFPWDGGDEDVVKVCFPTANGGTTCCATEEFNVPNCCDPDPCKIYDLKVIKTPCLCGQFFALVTFQFDNVGDEGFDIAGNGTNYGNFPYNYPQPIILGPFNGDGTTDYEFVVKDHQDPDCADDFQLGTVDCMTPVVDPGSDATLSLSPNPTSSWLNVTAQLQSGAQIGESTVEIYHADGRLVRTITVQNGNNFQLDVADLPSGVYRLTLMAATGRVEGTFAKQ